MEKYYYKHDGGRCNEECPIGLKTPSGSFTIKIGGGFCQECKHYKGGSSQEHYVICKHLQPKETKRKTNWKKILLRIAAVFSYLLVMFIGIGISIKYFEGIFELVFLSLTGVFDAILSMYLWNLSNKK